MLPEAQCGDCACGLQGQINERVSGVISEQFTDVIESIKRIDGSGNGNPAYRVTFASGRTHRTQADASIAYGITNPEYQDVPVLVSLQNDQIVYAEPQEPPKAMSEREAYVTEQVALWIENDGEYIEEARANALAEPKGLRGFEQFLTRIIGIARKGEAAWHVQQELSPNDWGRIRWDVVADRVKAQF